MSTPVTTADPSCDGYLLSAEKHSQIILNCFPEHDNDYNKFWGVLEQETHIMDVQLTKMHEL